jgi:phosphoserine phosphatase
MTLNPTFLLTLSGHDRPGITAHITKILHENHFVILDIAQSLLHQWLSLSFKIMTTPSTIEKLRKQSLNFDSIQELDALFRDYCQKEKMQLYIKDISLEIDHNKSSRLSIDLADECYFLSCQGVNRLHSNFLYQLSSLLASENINIHQISHEEKMPWLPNEFPDNSPFGLLEIKLSPPTRNFKWQKIKEKILKIASDFQIDISLIRDDLWRYHKRVIVFDMDSTLIEGEVIDELAKLVNKSHEIEMITKAAMNGEIDFDLSLCQRVAMLKDLPSLQVESLMNNIKLNPGVSEVISVVKKLGFKVGVISGGFTLFTDYLKKKLQLDFTFANSLEIVDGKLTGKILGPIINSQEKARLLDDICEKYHIHIKQIVAVGDGANDIPMLTKAGLGIAYHAKEIVKQNTDQQMNYGHMSAILPFLGISPGQMIKLLNN